MTAIDLTYRQKGKYDCSSCRTRCDDRSLDKYMFEADLRRSEKTEDVLRQRLEHTLRTTVLKPEGRPHGPPDLEILVATRVVARVEVKVQGRAFMKVQNLLPLANLRPYETVALNVPDLDNYIALHAVEKLPIYLVWYVKRPCLGEGYWGQALDILHDIYRHYGLKRKFVRRSGAGDVVDGRHKGETRNYHFSLQEMLPLEHVEQQLQRIVATHTRGHR